MLEWMLRLGQCSDVGLHFMIEQVDPEFITPFIIEQVYSALAYTIRDGAKQVCLVGVSRAAEESGTSMMMALEFCGFLQRDGEGKWYMPEPIRDFLSPRASLNPPRPDV